MKILLIEHPRDFKPERCNDIANTPLSSCLVSGYAAGMLQSRGHEVEIVEGYLEKLQYSDILAIAVSFRPDIVGVHMVYQWGRDIKLSGFLLSMKDSGLCRHITAYGFYPTVAFRSVLNNFSALDSIVLGEPENPFAELAETVSSGKSVAGIAGVAVRSGDGEVLYNRPDVPQNPDTLPFPVRTEALYRLNEVNLLGSRGCYGSCTFCYINKYYGGAQRWRGRGPENITGEINEIIAETGKREFYFTDPNFFGPGRHGQERALRLASLLKPLKIKFGIEGRVNDIHDKTIEALVDAGLRNILIGLESGRNESLRRMNKMTTVEQNEQALRTLRKHGIEPNVGFIMFEPDSSLEDVRTNFEFLKRNNLLNNLPVTANVLYHHQIILEGTQAYSELAGGGRLNLLNDTGYEGSAYFKAGSVSCLSGIMRRITNHLFQKMDGVWSGRVIAPPDSGRLYEDVNNLLVRTFDDALCGLEAEGTFSAVQEDEIVERTNRQISEMLAVRIKKQE
ncbi:MAG: radical SAM protein [Nitrospirae bacterium]|nr:MAG: radical SAM protein [Nitrospirota bacterium]